MEQEQTTDLRDVLEQLRAQLAALTDRVAQLEGIPSTAPVAPQRQAQAAEAPSAAAEPSKVEESISEDIVLAISAAVAAFLGERVHIRQIRVLSSPAWAQQGRVWIQASHRLH